MKDMMNNTSLIINTMGYLVEFTFYKAHREINASYKYFNITIKLTLKVEGHSYSVQSKLYSITDRDLERMEKYLYNHIIEVEKNILYASEVFTTQELFFQMQALPGDIWYDDNSQQLAGDFTFSFLIDITSSSETRTYWGGQSIVEVQEIIRFIEQIKHLLADD
jgi:hypothetical protein